MYYVSVWQRFSYIHKYNNPSQLNKTIKLFIHRTMRSILESCVMPVTDPWLVIGTNAWNAWILTSVVNVRPKDFTQVSYTFLTCSSFVFTKPETTNPDFHIVFCLFFVKKFALLIKKTLSYIDIFHLLILIFIWKSI